MTESASQSLVDRNWEMFLRDIDPFSKKLTGSIRIDMNDVRSIQAAAARITELEVRLARLLVNPADQRYWEGRYRDEKMRADAAESELSRVEVETIERCANFLAREYPDNANTNAFCAAIRSLPPLAKRGDQESPSKQTQRERE